MDDFYAECDEHLLALRRSLLKLEEGTAAEGSQELEAIFRRLHSLKGIFGMAGLQNAESVAHLAEDYLRQTMQEGQTSTEGVDALTQAAGILEQMAVAHREGQGAPEGAATMQRLERLIAEGRSGQARSGAESGSKEGKRGGAVWLCRFVPSAELDREGINLNTVRPRLQEVGTILRSTPKVQSEGVIAFEFVVEAPPDADQREDWARKGITFTRYAGQIAEEGAGVAAAAVPGENAEATRVARRAAAFVAPSHVVRVDLSRLDELMRIMGEMVLHRARLEESLSRVSGMMPTAEERGLQEINGAFTRELRHLREALMRVRLVPVSEIFDRMPFVARDLAHQSGKKVRLAIDGQDTEIDKYLVERLKDPLLHLVRNAISHGIERPEARARAKKAEEGVISLKAATAGETVVIEVWDDGAGIDTTAVMERARRAGIRVAEEGGSAALLEVICTPGFSTREEADLGSGRGMGMAAVRNTISELGGELEMTSEPGQGTRFVLRLPLTLAIADALVIASGGQRFAVPQSSVQEITMGRSSSVKYLEENELMSYRSGVLPLIRLSALFGLPAEERAEFPVLVVGSGRRAVGLVADRVLGQREIVVRTMSDPLLKVPAISGATELGDGQAVLILDSLALVQAANQRKGLGAREGASTAVVAQGASL